MENRELFVEIITDNSASNLDRLFTYKVSGELSGEVQVGKRVLVPFGRGNKMIKGLIVNVLSECDVCYNLKYVQDILDEKPLISRDLMDLGLWMKEEYLSPYLDAFQPILPPGDYRQINNIVRLVDSDADTSKLLNNEMGLYKLIAENSPIDLENLKKIYTCNNINALIRKMEDLGLVEVELEVVSNIQKKTERWVKLLIEDRELAYEKIGSMAKKQLEIYDYLYEVKSLSLKDVLMDTSTTNSTVNELEKKGLVEYFQKEVLRNPIKRNICDYLKIELNEGQKLVYDEIVAGLYSYNQSKFLIHGVTGSGKTEVYLQLVEHMLKNGKDSIILVPEISLTPQTVDRFVGRFGENVAVLHSKLSYGERFDEWRRINRGDVKIVVGARSAIFAPFKNLGLIVIDEEHENSYKSFQNPKYNTIEVAVKRSEFEGAGLVLGSATPSVESYNKAVNGDYMLLELNERANKKELPEIQVVDMRDELSNGNRSIFSDDLYDSLKKNLEDKKQSILFLNRRGFSTFVSCRSCGYVVKCDDCDVSMTYHKNKNQMRCHYCGKTIRTPEVCPVCKSPYIKYFGIGTEKIEDFTKEMFPNARVMRMDGDTTTEKDSYEKKLELMKKGQVDILVGTQMIAKGLDFENVTLVGIVAADINLNLPDFRSSEKTFQLINQVSGRAGRGEHAGKVILQTYDPSKYSIEFAREYDYKGFYEKEDGLRRIFNYPPYTNILRILIYGESNLKVENITKEVYSIIIEEYERLGLKNPKESVIGPYPSPIERIKNNFRWQILLKANDEDFSQVKKLVSDICIKNMSKLDFKNIKVSIDVDPSSVL